ncbi:hypothetical protein DSO57_1001742 [Entomophthora muscae]|uniref:Uncharacterized protein n=1 Tax=Entomophthora muscae TaxID=34485 RepID=A0ACC2SM04_9FUNG|nr:hypothetical protein DSO57_1001742 [Entomophthora muscae]
MYPVCDDEDPLVTLIPASQVILPPSLPPTPGYPPPIQVVGLCSLTPPPTEHPACAPRTTSP